ncbi:hypothetical protein Celaphus_00007302 [Cervus elaphus hippelaphus]|uniref:C2 domain-containing protein n=1 Tax=Cervus elaphus hippelaphus TaxID=46360 RepID=A0A212CZH2_CEREH|nr:hypothetical protein Celaphus_00007302 [Cervus elaphus hippelaphus]
MCQESCKERLLQFCRSDTCVVSPSVAVPSPPGLPDPFAKVVVDGSGQCHSTDTVKNTLDPKWNQHYDLYVGKTDSITISVWNHKKIHKKQGAGFLGCVRLLSNAISRLKDTGCKNPTLFCLLMH